MGRFGLKMKQYEIYLVNLNPTLGAEINKVRPCLVISPDELNEPLKTVIVAPLTTKMGENYLFRPISNIEDKKGQIALDQIRTIDKRRCIKRVYEIDEKTKLEVKEIISKMLVE